MHNFADGIVIGASFKLCSHSMAWGIVAATIGHEIAQEISDFVVFTSAPLNFKPHFALVLNFIAGLSVIVGGVLVAYIDIEEGTIGLILAFGAGTFVYLATTVTFPAALQYAEDAAQKSIEAPRSSTLTEEVKHVIRGRYLLRNQSLIMCAFIVGAACIGLILIDHEHCEEEHEEH